MMPVIFKDIDVFVCPNCKYEDASYIPILKNKFVVCPDCEKTVRKVIVKMPFGPYMTMEQYLDLLKYINEKEVFLKISGKSIKYASCTFDFKTQMIHCVKLNNKEFYKANENRHKDLYKWIMEYLES
jgi:NAD-dependent SIR2 family protein deacetylase